MQARQRQRLLPPPPKDVIAATHLRHTCGILFTHTLPQPKCCISTIYMHSRHTWQSFVKKQKKFVLNYILIRVVLINSKAPTVPNPCTQTHIFLEKSFEVSIILLIFAASLCEFCEGQLAFLYMRKASPREELHLRSTYIYDGKLN